MNITQYRYILTIAKYRNLSRAAEALFVTQPALTRTLNRAEAEAGVKLFDRSVFPMELTYAGEAYVEMARQLVDLQDAMTCRMAELTGGLRGRLRVGMTSERGMRYLPRLLPQFRAAFPQVETVILEGNNAFHEKALLDGAEDLAIMAGSGAVEGLRYQEIGREQILLVAPRTHPLASYADLSRNGPWSPDRLDPARLEGQDFVVLNASHGMGRYAQQIFERFQLRVNTVMTLDNNLTAYRLAEAGYALAFTTTGTAIHEAQGHAVYFILEEKSPMRRICAVSRTGGYLPEYARRFIDMTGQMIRDERPAGEWPEEDAPQSR